MMTLTAEPSGCGALLVRVDGDLDVYEAPHLRELLIGVQRGGTRRLIIDLNQCDYIDSTGLGVLVGALKRVRAVDGSIAVICEADRILRILRMTGLVPVLNVCGSLVDAHSAVGA
jgi:anti-sigma B factor antagonist